MDERRILVVVRHLGALRHYERVIRSLAGEGVAVSVRHSLEVATDDEVRELFAGVPGVRLTAIAPDGDGDARTRFVRHLRQLVDVLRYADPDYTDSHYLRERAYETVSSGVGRQARRVAALGPHRAAEARRILRAADRALPPPEVAGALLDEERPDVVVVANAMWWASSETDILKAAAARRIPTAIWIPSWDNLTNKGLIGFEPDSVAVWNDLQVEELARYHGIARERALVTGAQTFDRWFEIKAEPGRATGQERLGLDPDQPYLLYLGSSRQIAPDEPPLFERWLEAVRASALGDVQVVVRPHPTASIVRMWLGHGIDRLPNVVLDPATTDFSHYDPAFAERYADILRSCAAAVGINTSAMIEAAVFDRPVLTFELPEIADRQHGTLHYRYLVDPQFGFVRTAPTLVEHVDELARALDDPVQARQRAERFVRAFVRPYGPDVPAAPLLVEGTAALVGGASAVKRPGLVSRALGRTLLWVAPVVGLPLEDRRVIRIVARVYVGAVVGFYWVRAAVRRVARLARGRL